MLSSINIIMLKFVLFALATVISAQDTDDWCSGCKEFVESFDGLNATTLANEACSVIELDGLCEDIAPYIIEWVQDFVTPETVCSEWCATGEDYDQYGDYDIDLHVTKDLHHHPFDIPHHEEPSQHVPHQEDLQGSPPPPFRYPPRRRIQWSS